MSPNGENQKPPCLSDQPVSKRHHLKDWPLLVSHPPFLLQHLAGAFSIPCHFRTCFPGDKNSFLICESSERLGGELYHSGNAVVTQSSISVTFRIQPRAGKGIGKHPRHREEESHSPCKNQLISFRKSEERGACVVRGCKA